MSAADWTDERVAKLRTMWLQGFPCSHIAMVMNGLPGGRITRNAVIGKVTRLGLPGRLTPQRKVAPTKTKIARTQTVKAPAPPPQPAPVKLRAPPAKGANSVRFIDRTRSQCAMFCDGESGPDGFVCGRPAQGSWCKSCMPLVFAPVKQGKAA